MTPRAYLGGIFLAHYALYQYHIKCRDDDEVTADLARAPIIRDALSKRYGLDAADGFGWFMDEVRMVEQRRSLEKQRQPFAVIGGAP